MAERYHLKKKMPEILFENEEGQERFPVFYGGAPRGDLSTGESVNRENPIKRAASMRLFWLTTVSIFQTRVYTILAELYSDD
jgi:hypothetical protein